MNLHDVKIKVYQHWPLNGVVIDCSLIIPGKPTVRVWKQYSQRAMRQHHLRRQWLVAELEALINSISDTPIDTASDDFKAIERRVYWQIQDLLESG